MDDFDPDPDPDILARAARAAAPPPEIEVLQQMLSETLSREMAARVEAVRLRRQARK